MLEIFAQAWSARPHLRLGQLIYNAVQNGLRSINLYDCEDADLLDCLVTYCGLDMRSQGSTSHAEADKK